MAAQHVRQAGKWVVNGMWAEWLCHALQNPSTHEATVQAAPGRCCSGCRRSRCCRCWAAAVSPLDRPALLERGARGPPAGVGLKQMLPGWGAIRAPTCCIGAGTAGVAKARPMPLTAATQMRPLQCDAPRGAAGGPPYRQPSCCVGGCCGGYSRRACTPQSKLFGSTGVSSVVMQADRWCIFRKSLATSRQLATMCLGHIGLPMGAATMSYFTNRQ